MTSGLQSPFTANPRRCGADRQTAGLRGFRAASRRLRPARRGALRRLAWGRRGDDTATCGRRPTALGAAGRSEILRSLGLVEAPVGRGAIVSRSRSAAATRRACARYCGRSRYGGCRASGGLPELCGAMGVRLADRAAGEPDRVRRQGRDVHADPARNRRVALGSKSLLTSTACRGSAAAGCVIEEEARRRWNASCQRRLSRLYETVQQAVRREVGMRANLLAVGKEAQRRGAVTCTLCSGLRRRSSCARRSRLASSGAVVAEAALLFGHLNAKFVKPKPAREAAAYLSSYFLGGRGHKAKLTEAVLNRELPRLPLYVSRRLTRATRTTMRNKRRQRHLHVCRDRGRPDPRGRLTERSWSTCSASRSTSSCGCCAGRSCASSSVPIRSAGEGRPPPLHAARPGRRH